MSETCDFHNFSDTSTSVTKQIWMESPGAYVVACIGMTFICTQEKIAVFYMYAQSTSVRGRDRKKSKYIASEHNFFSG